MIHAGRNICRKFLGRKFLRVEALDESWAAQSVSGGIVLEKMHLCHFAFEGENSIVAARERRKNFLFAR
jgi:hypothetical protein